MTIILKEGIDRSSGRLEFYLAALEMPADFDRVLQSLAELKNLSTFERVEGIYSRIGKIEMGDVHFQVVYHEDVGVYAFSTDNTDQSNKKLRHVLRDVVEEMNCRSKSS